LLICLSRSFPKQFALKANSNGKYVRVDKDDKKEMYANSNLYTDAETFVAEVQPESTKALGQNEVLIALKSLKNGKYLSARDKSEFYLVADATSVQDTEKFFVYYNGINAIGLKSKASNKFLCADPDEDDPLTVDRDEFHEWETFEVVPVADK
jgi:hypothetical protein